MTFWEYDLEAEALHIGERIKKGTFRPLVPTRNNKERPVPYTTAGGALREFLGLSWDVPLHAAGYLTEGRVEHLTVAPRDHVTGVARIPITVQYLSKAKGKLFVLVDARTKEIPAEFCMVMGGMRYKGLGRCRLKRASAEPVQPERGEGTLLTRIPEEALGFFGADPEEVRKDGPFRRGYLLKPTSMFGGVYVRSLFEGSMVEAFRCMVEVGHEIG